MRGDAQTHDNEEFDAEIVRRERRQRDAVCAHCIQKSAVAGAPCPAAPFIRLLDIGSQFRSTLSLRSVTLTQLCFASLTVISSRRDFHLQECAHAGRT